MSFITDIPLIVDGITTLDANGINPILEALKANTLNLDERLNNLSGSAGLIYSDNAFSDAVLKHEDPIGLLLAWDSVNSVYIPASAAWTEAADGKLIPADSAYVIGVLVSEISEGTGYATILSYGWTTDKAVIGALTSDKFVTGPYYLGVDGKAVPAAEAGDMSLPVYCFTYTSTGKLVFSPRSPEKYGHRHGKFILDTKEFTEVATGGSTYMPTDGGLISLLKSYPESCQLFKNGLMVVSDDWSVADGAIKLNFMPMADDELILFAVTPTVGYDPLVHSIKVDPSCNILVANNSSGNVELGFNDTPVEENKLTGTAVVALYKSGFATGPVVQRIYAGAGTTISEARDADNNVIPGGAVISTNYGIFDPRDLQVCNLDGVLFGLDATKVGYKFPAGVTSSLYGTVRLPYFEAGAGYEAVLSLIVDGSTAGYPDLAAQITPMYASADGKGKVDSIPVTLECSSLGSVGNTYYLLETTLESVPVTPNGLLSCKLTCEDPVTPLTVLGISLSLKVIQQ